MDGRRVALALAVLALPVGVTACGGKKSPSSSASATPLDAVTGAATKTAGAGSEHLTLQAAGAAAGQQLTLKGSGDFDTKQRVGTFKLDLQAGPIGTTIDEVLSGTDAYLKSPLFSVVTGGKAWLKLDLATVAKSQGLDLSSLLAQDPSRALDALKAVKSATKVGSETVGGASTTHYRVRVDRAKVASTAGTLAAQVPAAYDVWVGDDGYVHRVRTNIDSATGAQKTAVTLTVELSDFGKKVAVSVPPAAQTAASNGSIPGLGG